MEKEWVRIFETTNEVIIEMSRQLLEESDIDSVVLNKKDSFYNFGHIELYVHRDNVIRAKQVLKNLID